MVQEVPDEPLGRCDLALSEVAPALDDVHDASFLVRFVDVEDPFNAGRSREEALFNAAEVLPAMLARRVNEAEDVPPPSAGAAVEHISPDGTVQVARLLRIARGERSLSNIARALENGLPAANSEARSLPGVSAAGDHAFIRPGSGNEGDDELVWR